ncbi:HAD family hydrolase [Pontibacter flavimaris]|uniref:Haloacid dehalogenase n=1 Tax=Pontibacter flavimaris TaxID=1797110 RepID=A0A1Q5PH02_9BACT|nr:HAD family hydrolase [Pontibacter flavimaris]OKL41514.1 haloacid dehalogenase [Pontibacter flavimaris]
MAIKALIIDLDNTIYPVPSIGEELFKPFFDVLEESGEYEGDLDAVEQDMMRIPFQKVAKKYKFSEQLKQQGDEILRNLKYEKDIPPFEDYKELQALPQQKFLVTTGYTNMQESKVEKLNLRNDFAEVHIVDPSKSDLTKKDVFRSIVERYKYAASEVLVIGDDPESELKAGRELGLGTVLYAKDDTAHGNISPRITHFGQLKEFLA